MIKDHKIISLSVIGLVVGGVIGAVAGPGQVDMLSAAVVGAVVGFLAGWVWNTRSSESAE